MIQKELNDIHTALNSTTIVAITDVSGKITFANEQILRNFPIFNR